MQDGTQKILEGQAVPEKSGYSPKFAAVKKPDCSALFCRGTVQ
jgi:hypothetical protein